MNATIDKDKILAQNPKADPKQVEEALKILAWARLQGVTKEPATYPVPFSQTIFDSGLKDEERT